MPVHTRFKVDSGSVHVHHPLSSSVDVIYERLVGMKITSMEEISPSMYDING